MPSAYVSRAPSPPPVFDSQLPVPEKSYLEVPNPTTSVHTSRSREIPSEPEAADKGKRRESTTSGGGPPRSMSTSRHISGIEIPGPIALTDSNSSRRSGSGRLSETLNSVWGNNPPSAGPSASNSVLASPLEGPTTRSALLNALKPLASVPEGSAIPEVIHADPGADTGAQVYHNEPPKTPKAETPRPSASPSRIPVSASAAATSPKPAATPKAGSRISTTTVSPRRGLSVYSNGSQQPPADAAPQEPPATMPEQGASHSEPQFVATPKGVSRAPTKPSTRSASPHPPAVAPEQEAVLGEPHNLGIPRSVSRVSSKPPTRSASPKPPAIFEQEDPTSQPTGFAPSNIDAESYVLAAEAELHAPPADVGPPAPAPAPVPEQSEPPAAATNVTDDDGFIAPTKSKASSRRASKLGSKMGSKAATPKGSQTPKQTEPTTSAWGQSASVDVSVADAPRSLSAAQSPLASVPEHPVPEVVPLQGNATPVEAPLEGQSGLPGGFFVANPDETVTTPPEQAPGPTQSESPSFSSGFGALGGGVGGMIGAATSTFGSFGGWGIGSKKDKSKSPTPGSTTPGWGGAFGGGVATSAAESTGGVGWGPATGNGSKSSSTWFDQTAKSVNASTADLFSGGGSNAEHMLELDNIPASENRDYHLPDLPGQVPLAETGAGAFQMEFGGEGAFQGETGGEGATQEETQGAGASAEETHHARDPLTLNTDVPPEAGAATAAPTTAESPEGGEGGGDGDGDGGDEGGEKAPEAPEDDWGIPVKTKKKKGGASAAATAAATPTTAATDDWSTPTTKKKKKGKGK